MFDMSSDGFLANLVMRVAKELEPLERMDLAQRGWASGLVGQKWRLPGTTAAEFRISEGFWAKRTTPAAGKTAVQCRKNALRARKEAMSDLKPFSAATGALTQAMR